MSETTIAIAAKIAIAAESTFRELAAAASIKAL
jgi:hypothetical protein